MAYERIITTPTYYAGVWQKILLEIILNGVRSLRKVGKAEGISMEIDLLRQSYYHDEILLEKIKDGERNVDVWR